MMRRRLRRASIHQTLAANNKTDKGFA